VLVLSQKDIEVIGYSVLRDCVKGGRIRIPVDIEGFARYYLGLQIEYRKLSDKGNILGLTSYKGVVLELSFNSGNIHITVPEDTILLDELLENPKEQHRRRFTIAHECAHQILARMEDNRTSLVPGKTYSCRELRSAEDWSEWQANALGAVLLIPKHELIKELNSGWRKPFKPVMYGNRFNTMDYQQLKSLAKKFGVSVSAMKIRLKELGSIIRKDASEYHDPLEIICG
jgi:Zn-dependent peptidase ImmA (M78 family)